ncbi:cell division protein ZipA [Parahaliea mediterranea]|uniref:cell division protein ZipA n=1 Tax=Parahaliea mediterranea TaxID=651086 RepID=UPI001F4E68AB|nr:cell division protein ZipA [Parahaliea mediterranea]
MADLTIRDWMVIIGTLLILAVLADAWRRIYQDRRAPVRMKLSASGDEGEEDGRSARDIDLAWLKELPNGGARVVDRDAGRDDEYDASPETDDEIGDEAMGESAPEPRAAQAPIEPAAVAEDPLDEAAGAAPLSEPVPPRQTAQPARAVAGSEPALKQAPPQQSSQQQRQSPAPRQAESETAPRSRPSSRDEDDVELFSGMSSSDEPENLDWLDALEAEPKPEPAMGGQTRAQLPRDVASEVFMLNVVARDPQGFRGDDIMQILLACGLRFGDMSFFHRHEHDTGKGPIQFSVANMLQPGVFDIDRMDDFTTKGLVFFVTLPGPDDMMKAYDYMLETAQAVARNLKGDVLDETRSVLTRQTLEHARQQIRDLERRLLAKAR